MFVPGSQLASQRHSDQVRFVHDVRGDKVVEVPRCLHDVHSKMRWVLFLCESLGSWTCMGSCESCFQPSRFTQVLRVSSFSFVRLCWAREIS